MFGINGAEVLVLLLVALVVVGPERLPGYAEQLGRWARQLRVFVAGAKERVAQEMGEEAVDVDWSSLDPRRYDPRRIVRDALLEDLQGPSRPAATGRRYSTAARRAERAAATGAVAGAAAGAPTGAAGQTSGPGAPRPAGSTAPDQTPDDVPPAPLVDPDAT